MKITRSILLGMVLAVALLGACAAPPAIRTTAVTVATTAEPTRAPVITATTQASPTPAATQPPATPAKSNPETLPIEDLPENAVLMLRREGGFAGRRDLWTVYKTGKIETNKGETQQIGADAVSTLLKDMDALGFFELKEDYRNPNCADCFEYTVTATTGTKTKTIRTNDAGQMPPALRQIIDRITSDIGNVK